MVGIDRQLTEAFWLSAGVKAELSEVDDLSASEPLFFVGLPLGLRLDTTDNLLDPRRGFRVAFQAEPYLVDRTFLRTSLAASTYLDLLEDGGLVLAVRTRLGSVVGEELFDVPSDKRFYSGGGGSVVAFIAHTEARRHEEEIGKTMHYMADEDEAPVLVACSATASICRLLVCWNYETCEKRERG